MGIRPELRTMEHPANLGLVVIRCKAHVDQLQVAIVADFFLSPKTQMALSALHRLQGLAPSHYFTVKSNLVKSKHLN